jgi:uncharacterized protein (TIGR03435 family)
MRTRELRLTACVAAIALAWSLSEAPRAAQPPTSQPTFETATIKPNTSASGSTRMQMLPGGRLMAENMSLQRMVRGVFQKQTFQITGGPPWFDTDRFDIVAKAEGNPTQSQMIAMARVLLTERFKLVTHIETREQPIYELVLVKPGVLGPQLKRSAVDCAALMRGVPAPAPSTPPAPGSRPDCGTRQSGGSVIAVIAGGLPMTEFALALAQLVGRWVADRTGLTGGYDLDLSFTPDQPRQVMPLHSSPPSRKQLGLKLESARGPVEMLVIDRAERPVSD